MSAGENAQTTSSDARRAIGRPARGSASAARIATAIHMIWKYLFMSNSTALTTTTFGTMNRATIQATRNQRAGSPRAVNAGDDRQHERDAQVGQVEERDRGRPVAEARLAPAERRTGTPRCRPAGRSAPTMNGAARTTGARNRTASRPDRPRPPRAGRHDVQRRRSGRSPGRRRTGTARGARPGRRPAGRRAGRRSRQATTSRTTVDEPGQPERRRPVGQEARPEDRGDLEVRPAVGPGVVVRQSADQVDDVAAAGDEVADEPDPAQPAAEADEDRRDRGDAAGRRSAGRRAPRRRGRGRPRTARWSAK